MKHLFDKQNKYGIRKLSIGVCSAVIGLSFLAPGLAEAEQHEATNQPVATEVPLAETESESEVSPVEVVGDGERLAIHASTTAAPVPGTAAPGDAVLVDRTQAAASTAQTDHPATHAVDTNINTYWQSNPEGNAPTTLTVKMTEVATLNKVTYTPRQVTEQDPASPNPRHHAGLLTKGRLDYSLNGTDWEPVTPTTIDGDAPGRAVVNADKTFNLGGNNNSRVINFQPVNAQYLRLTVLESWANGVVGTSGIVTAANFIPEGVKPAAPADTTGGGTGTQNQPQPTTATSNLIKELSNETLTTQNGTKIALGDDVKNHLKTADSGTVYIEFRAPENNAILYTLFNATSGTNHNQYTALYSKSGQIGAEIRPGASIDLSDGTQRAKNGEWNAVALTYEKNPANDKNLVKIYVNGVLSTSREITEDVFKDITDLQHAQIGAAQRANGAVWGLNGLEVRNFKLFSNALTEAEILERSAQFKREPKVLPTNPGEEVSDKVVVFQGGSNNQRHEGVHAFRIPALLKTLDGTLLAATDQRHTTSGDWGDIATVIKRSTDNGATWGETIKVVDLRNSDTGPASADPMTIDPAFVQDPTTKRIYVLYDMFPDAANDRGMGGAFGLTFDQTPAHTIINGKTYVNVFKNGETAPYTVRENGVIHTPAGEATTYRVNVNDKSVGYANIGDLYEGSGTTPVGNIYHRYDNNTPFKVLNKMFIWMSYSDDDGRTWSSPKDITTSVKKDYMNFLGLGPGTGIVLEHGPNKGRLVIPAYSSNFQPNNSGPLYNGSQSMLLFYSDDHGETWKSGESVNDNRTLSNGTVIHSSTMSNAIEQKTEATVIQLKNGDIKVFMRGLTGKLAMATSKDSGLTFESDLVNFDDVNEVGVQLSAVRVERDGKEYVVLANADGPGRANGHVRVAEVDADGNLKWINHRQIEEGFFAYNSLQYLGNDEFGLIYESKVGAENDYTQRYRKFNWTFLTSPEPKLPDINVANVAFEGDNLAVLTFEESVLPTNNPSLLLSNGNTAQFVEQRDAKTLVYRIQPGDKDKTVLEVASGDISNVNGPKVNVVTKLDEDSNLSKINNKAIRATAGNADAWQPGAGPDKLLDGNKASLAELKWDMPSNHVNGAYPEAWRLPQKVTVSTRDGQPIDVASLLITKRTPGNGTLTKYKVEAYKGDQKVHDSGEVAVDFTKAEVAHEFASPVNADRVVLTLLEAKQNAAGAATPTMLTLRELALFGPREATREREVTEVLAYDTITREDSTKPSTYREETEGVNGSLTKRIRETLVNGLVTRTEEIGQGTRVEPRNKVITIGTGGAQATTEKRERRVTEIIPFATDVLTDPNAPAGDLRTEEGRNGSVVKVYEDTYVNGALTELGTEVVREEDRVPAFNKKVYVGTRPATQTTPTPTSTTRRVSDPITVAFETLTYTDSTLPEGQEIIVRPGVNGRMVKVYEETLTDGQVITRRLVDITDVVPATAQLVRRGTGPVATANLTTIRREVNETLDFTTETLDDSSLDVGTELVVREGVPGRVIKVYEDTLTNGVKTSERVVDERAYVAPVNKLVLRGTRPVLANALTTERRRVTEAVPFETKRIDDPSLSVGQEVVAQEGRDGQVVKVYEDTLTNGVKTAERLVDVQTVSLPVTKIIHVGSRPATVTSTKTREVPEDIPFETKRIEDDSLEAGKEVLVQAGQVGLLIKVYEDTYTDGLKTGERQVDLREVTLPVTEVIRVGTKVIKEEPVVDPETTVEPTLPEEPTKPVETEQPAEPTKPVETEQPAEPTKPVETEQPAEPTKPVETEQPTEPTKPVETEQPTEPTKPVETEQPAEPTKPAETEQPAEPTKPAETEQPAEPTKPVETEQPAEPTKPVETEQPAEPTKPVETVQPTEPATPSPARVVTDPVTGVSVSLAEGEDANIVALRIVHKETRDVATPAILAGKDYDLFDIELVDKNGQVVKTKFAAIVSLPVDAGKEVSEVVYLPNSDQATSLPFQTAVLADGKTIVVFTAEHFSEYGIVYKPQSSSVVSKETPAPAQPKLVSPAPAASTSPAASSTAASSDKPETLPETGDANSALVAIGSASLLASLGLVGLKKKD